MIVHFIVVKSKQYILCNYHNNYVILKICIIVDTAQDVEPVLESDGGMQISFGRDVGGPLALKGQGSPVQLADQE
jgi:hypothetical protein